jgi:hypothetical protein
MLYLLLFFQTLHVSIKPIILACLLIKKLKIQGKNVIFRDLKNDIKCNYKLHRLVILGGVSCNTKGVVCNLKLKIKKIYDASS